MSKQLTDTEVAEAATRVRMLGRSDLDHEAVCVIGRDCIRTLAEDRRRLRLLVLAAADLIRAAKGPEDGPTNWNETREDWTSMVKECTAFAVPAEVFGGEVSFSTMKSELEMFQSR